MSWDQTGSALHRQKLPALHEEGNGPSLVDVHLGMAAERVRSQRSAPPSEYERFRKSKDEFFATDPGSSLSSEQRGRFASLSYFPADRAFVVDFHLAYNAYCAYNDAWTCPLPPLENWLRVPIRAGERAYPHDH